jgi:hypothetical protein
MGRSILPLRPELAATLKPVIVGHEPKNPL